MKNFEHYLFFVIIFTSVCFLHGKELSSIKKLHPRSKSEINLERAFDEFRAASDGINKKLLALKTEISNHSDQNGVDAFTKEISDLRKDINSLQSTILINKKEDSLQGILNVNKRYLKLGSDWETFKMKKPGNSRPSQSGYREELLNLSDKIISLQFEVLRYSGDLREKGKLSSALKELQNLLSDVLTHLSESDSSKTKEKIHLIESTLEQLSSDWAELQTATIEPWLTTPTSANPAVEDTRLGMASTIRDLLVKLTDLKYQIKNSTIESNQKNAYLLAVSSAEKLLLLLQSVLPKVELNALFGRIFEVKDLIQDIIFDWNSNNPMPLTTTTSSNDPFADIKKTLNSMDSSLFSIKLDILSFPGDQLLVEPFLKRSAGIQKAVDQLQSDLLYTDISKAEDQTDLLLSSFRKLREDFDTFLADYQASTAPETTTTALTTTS